MDKDKTKASICSQNYNAKTVPQKIPCKDENNPLFGNSDSK